MNLARGGDFLAAMDLMRFSAERAAKRSRAATWRSVRR